MTFSDPGSGGAESPRESELLEALEEYQRRLQDGKPLSRREFLDRYAHLEGELIGYLSGLELAHRVGRTLEAPKGVHAPLPAERIGDFRVIREVGRGGMGIVYEA